MRSEALDITIESRRNAIWLRLSGPFHNEQVPNIRQKITGLIDDGNKDIVIDLENVIEIKDAVIPMFLALLNLMKGKRGQMSFVFRNAVATTAFSGYRHIFSIYPDAQSLAFSGFLNNIRRRGILLSRKTGIRLSRPVAIFILAILAGLFMSLAYIIQLQTRELRAQETQIHEMTEWKQKTSLEVEELRERIRPLDQLGLLRDTLPR